MSAKSQSPCMELAAPLAHCQVMNNSLRGLGLIVSGVLCMASAADTRESRLDERILTVLVQDYAGLSDNSLREMEAVSSELLAPAGIQMHWVHCRGHQPGTRPELCGAYLEKGLILLRILTTYPGKHPCREPLGMAAVDNGYASVFVTEIRRYAEHNGLDAGTLMAYAATHEFGHLLLGRSHSPWGIMQAVWRETAYRDMNLHWFGFSENQRRALRDALPPTELRLARLR